MPTPQLRGAVEAAWAHQRVWSQTANRLKQQIDGARTAALLLAIATAVLTTTAVQVNELSPPVGRVLTAAAAITAGVATFMQRRAGTDQIRAWTRARSASEGLKSEIYSALGGGSLYSNANRDQTLTARTREIIDLVQDLKRHTLGVPPDGKPLPAVHDVDSYINMRVNGQIDNYYTSNATKHEHRVRRLRTLGTLFGIAAVTLAALGTAFDLDGLALWIPVVTTIATSLTAHIAAARYDHLVIEYLRTAQRLIHLRDDYQRTPPPRLPPSSTLAKTPSPWKTKPGWPAGETNPTAPRQPNHRGRRGYIVGDSPSTTSQQRQNLADRLLARSSADPVNKA